MTLPGGNLSFVPLALISVKIITVASIASSPSKLIFQFKFQYNARGKAALEKGLTALEFWFQTF